ncbi:MAG: flagellar basal body P-ring formation protein FlgA [Spirochaetia bacterium]|nr:flagellar basal body P-ring formation protein FlgA [Spirochaetia bacterium]
MMKTPYTTGVLPAAVFAAAVVFSATPVFSFAIYLQPDAVVHEMPVRLRHVARVEGTGTQSDLADRILAVDETKPQYLSRDAVARELGLTADKIYGAGVWVVPALVKLGPGDIAPRLKNAMGAIQGGEDFLKRSRIEIETTALHVPKNFDSVVFRLPVRAQSLSPGRRTIPVDIVGIDGERKRTVLRQSLSVRIFGKVDVAVAARALMGGERLSQGDWKIETREYDTDDVPRVIDPAGRRVMNNIAAGSVLTPSSVQVMPSIRRGESVELVLQSSGVVVKCRSTAMREGNIGDAIPVRIFLPSGGKSDVVSARIVSEGIVEFMERGR